MAHNECYLRTGETLTPGQFLRSKNGLFHAVFQEDGNFVVYRGDSRDSSDALWASFPDDIDQLPRYFMHNHSPQYHITMQPDGNLVAFVDNRAYWALGSKHREVFGPNRTATLLDDGRFAIYDEKLDWKSRVYSNDRYDHIDESSLEWDRIDYDIAKARVTPDGPPKVELGSCTYNYSDGPGTPKISYSVSMSTTKGWKSTTSLKIGASTKIKTGIPFIVEGEVTTSIEATQSIELNEQRTETKSFNVDLTVTALPNRGVCAKTTYQVSFLKVPYKAKGTVKFNGKPNRIAVHVEGEFEGTSSHDMKNYIRNVPLPGGGGLDGRSEEGDIRSVPIPGGGGLDGGSEEGDDAGWQLYEPLELAVDRR